ncbi:YHS domain-containing protein [Paraburkholderia fungorum]|jgi:YHS domain-containing protein|nr:hypothetical protein [Paraburkholderia fungorum]
MMQWLSSNWIWVLLAVGVFLMMRRGGMACGMGGHRHTSREQPATDDRSPHDPVSGLSVDGAHALTSIFDGQTYYFESEQSRAEFNKDPQRFARGGTHRHHGGC